MIVLLNRLHPSLVIVILLQVFLFSEKAFAHEGWGIVVDRLGQIYFSDIPTNTIWKLNRDGKLEIAASNQHSHALIQGADKHIYGSHENGSVWKITSDGLFSEILPPSPDFPLNLHCFIIDGNGNIYSMNAKSVQSGKVMLLKRSPEGKITHVAGSVRGFRDGLGNEAHLMGIDGMAWSPDSSLYITDGPYVRKVTIDGSVSTIGGKKLTSERWGEDLMGLTTTSFGDLFLADYSSCRILKISNEGKEETILKSGGIWSPTGITVVGKELYVLEHLRMPLVILGNVGIGPYIRVLKFSADGKVKVLKTVWGNNTYVFFLILFVIISLVVFLKRFHIKRKKAKFNT
jgi:sugar lactone lactonase YvrE